MPGASVMLKNFGAVVVGLIVGMVWNMALIQLNTAVLFPMEEGTDMQNAEQFKAYMTTLPVQAFLVVLVAHIGQALIGGWVAARMAASSPAALAMIVGVLTAAGSAFTQVLFEGPTWMWIDAPLCLVAAWFVGRLETQRRASLG
ncbi:MAG: hypothetical protein ACI97A_001162 [Planctomycetota bacterium]|jgi:hypothetical protein